VADEISSGALDVSKNWVKNITAYSKPLIEVSAPSKTIRDIVASSKAVGEMISGKAYVLNAALLFDSASTIGTLSAKAAPVSSGEVNKALIKISNETAKAKNQMKEVIDQKSATEHILDYYRAMSDSALIAHGFHEIAGVIKDTTDPKTLGDKIKGWFSEIIDKINSIGARLKGIIGDFGNELLSAIEDLKKHVGGALAKVVDKFRALVTKFHDFTLYLIKKMFDFVGEVQEMAEERKFTMNAITMEMPSLDVEVVTVAGVPIPIPKVQTPKLTISFSPKEVARKA
jgi:hypothetical protein